MGVESVISSAAKSGHGDAVVYAGMIGLFLSDVIPTPADALYFHTEKILRDKWKKGQITPQQYWTRTALAYYGYNPIWWLLVMGIVIASKGDYTHKAKIGIALIGSGAVLGVIYKNIQADKIELASELPPKV